MSQTAPMNQVARNPQQALRTEGPATAENDSEEMSAEAKNALLVVAALIMTATYQAVLQPPGGLWQDDSGGSSNNSTDSNPDGHTAGKAVMGTKIPGTYVMFLFFNSMGFFGAYAVIWSLLEGFPRRRKRELRLALFALLITYDVSMGALTPNQKLNWFFVAISSLMPGLFSLIVLLMEYVRK